MRSTFKILFYINKNKIKTDGTTGILCRITIDGANVVMSTGESVAPHEWNLKRGETTDKKNESTLASLSGRNRTRVQQLALSVWGGECGTGEKLLARHREKSNDTACPQCKRTQSPTRKQE